MRREKQTHIHEHTIAATLYKRTKHVAFSSLSAFNKYDCVIIIKDGCFSLCGNAFFFLIAYETQVGNKKRMNSNKSVHTQNEREEKNATWNSDGEKKTSRWNKIQNTKKNEKKEKKIFNKIGNVCAQFFLSSSLRFLCFIFCFIYFKQFLAWKYLWLKLETWRLTDQPKPPKDVGVVCVYKMKRKRIKYSKRQNKSKRFVE